VFKSQNNPTSISNNQPSLFTHFSRIEDHRLIHIVILLRIAPVVPFGLCNYFLSSTTMSLPHIMFASFLGNFPGCLIYSFIGSSLESLSGADVQIPLQVRIGSAIIGGSATILVMVYIAILGRAALRSAVAEELIDIDEIDRDLQTDGNLTNNSNGHVDESDNGLNSEDIGITITEATLDVDCLTLIVEQGQLNSNQMRYNKIELLDEEKMMLNRLTVGMIVSAGIGIGLVLI
jgi:hypothetical protein